MGDETEVSGFCSGRKLLDLEPVPSTSSARREPNWGSDAVIIISALLCALVCALGFGFMLRRALRRSRRAVLGLMDDVALQVVSKGLKEEAVRAIPTLVYVKRAGFPQTESENECDCPICLLEFSEGEELRVLPKCSHRFHVSCIDTWLLDHSSCPSCRGNLAEVEERVCVKRESQSSEHHFLP